MPTGHGPPSGGQLALMLPEEPGRQPDPTIVLSFGMGVESTACLLRWVTYPDSRDFDLGDLLVVTAQTGDEWPVTSLHVTRHVLPRLRDAGIRYAQVARAGAVQADGIVILDDTRRPGEIYLQGAYRLSDELIEAGTVPQVGGARKCSAKAKGWPIDTFLQQAARLPFRQAVGFHTGEHGRARRDKTYDTPLRTGFYPLIEWGWDRARAARYIQEITGVADWPKSACVYCPFALTNKAGRQRVLRLYEQNPTLAIEALMLEHRAVCLNPTQGLIPTGRLEAMIQDSGRHRLASQFREALEHAPHTLYEVRRIRRPHPADPQRQANASRHLRHLATGTRRDMLALLHEHGPTLREAGVDRVWRRRRAERLPTTEHYIVAGPSGAIEKGDARFETWWAELTDQPGGQLLAA